MNILDFCMKIPNLGLLVFYLIFVITIPYVLFNYTGDTLKYYMPFMIALANMLTKSGEPHVFQNLYSPTPKNFTTMVSTNFINLFALVGILWQTLSYASGKQTVNAVMYGLVLYFTALVLARDGMSFILDNADYYMKQKTDFQYKYNWHKLVFGMLYIIFLIGFQTILLSLVDSTSSNLIKNARNNIKKNISLSSLNNI